jgi:hypothetical protein
MQSAKSGVSRLSAYLPMWPHASGMPQAGCQALSRSNRDTLIFLNAVVSPLFISTFKGKVVPRAKLVSLTLKIASEG